MHKKQLLVLLISFLIPAIGLAFEPELVIAPDELELTVGDSTQLTVTYIDSGGTEIDTVASWTVEPNSLATVSDSGLFIAVNPGECLVTATLDTLEAQITAIIDPVDDDTCQYGHLEVFPGDTLLALGDTLSYQAFYVHSQDSLTKATATWSMEGMPVGTLTAEGFFTATGQGFALIQATVDSLTATAFLVVVDSAADTSGINEITITRTSPSPQGYNVMRTLNEGELWKISGLPYPMNILNGGAVFFPPGSITENIRIHMELPGFAHPDSNAVKIGNQRVVGGVEFQVMVDDTVVEPYNFGTPLIAALVYKRGLIDNLGIDPQDLGLYFAMELGDSIVFDTTGIGYTTVDLCMNRIFSTVAHFSTLAIAETEVVVAADQPVNQPTVFQLYPNYPNPFNPETTISFSVPQTADINLTVFNLLGQEVVQLRDGIHPAGLHSVLWKGLDADGNSVSSGVYIYRLTSGDMNYTRKMILLK